MTRPGSTVTDASVVESEEAEPLGGPNAVQQVWFVAAEIEGPGANGSGDVGLWVTNIPPPGDGSGLIFGVNETARRFSILGVDVPVQADESDPAAQAAMECVAG